MRPAGVEPTTFGFGGHPLTWGNESGAQKSAHFFPCLFSPTFGSFGQRSVYGVPDRPIRNAEITDCCAVV